MTKLKWSAHMTLNYTSADNNNILFSYFNVYCPECPHPGGQQKKFLLFGHGRDLAAFKGTGLQNKSFQDRAEISKA